MELQEACAIFGITDVRILGFPQPFRLEHYPESIEALRDVILDVRPHVLITTSPSSDGQRVVVSGMRDDHTESVRALMDARTLASAYVRHTRPHRIAATYFMGVYYQRDELDFVVDVSDWYEQRVQAEALFESQGHTPAWARRRIDVSWGTPVGSPARCMARALCVRGRRCCRGLSCRSRRSVGPPSRTRRIGTRSWGRSSPLACLTPALSPC